MFGNKKISSKIKIEINGKLIEQVQTNTLLGIIDEKLHVNDLKLHINYLNFKISKIIGIINKVRSTIEY